MRGVRAFFALIGAEERGRLFALLPLVFLNGLGEMVGVGLVPLIVGALVAPDMVNAHALLARLSMAVPAGPSALWVLPAAALFYIARAALGLLLARAQQKLVKRYQLALGRRLFALYLAAPWPYLAGKSSNEIIRNLQQELPSAVGGIAWSLFSLAQAGFVAILVLGLLFGTHPLLTPFVLALLLVCGGGTVMVLRLRERGHPRLALADRAAQLGEVQHALGALREIRLLGRADWFIARFCEITTRLAETRRSESVRFALPGATMEVFGILAMLALAAVMLLRATPGPEILSTLALYAMALVRLKGALATIFSGLTALRFREVGIVHLAEEMAMLERQAPVDTAGPALDLHHAVRLDAVAFRYPGADRDALAGVTLIVPKGAVVGLTGVSGAGKSTLADLLLGLLTPDAGQVFIDGVPLRGSEGRWQRSCAYVPQTIFLIDASLRRNVALALPEAEVDEARVWRALADAGAADWVRTLPDGLASAVGERGVKLSGGQRQRIGLARALFADRPFLVIDEGTSALDEETEMAVLRAVTQRSGRTILMIAHRASTLAFCDTVFTLKEGVVEVLK